MVMRARIAKTKKLQRTPIAFQKQLHKDVASLVKAAARKGFTPAVRLNGTSDQPKLALQLAAKFPAVQFYDYTKLPKPWLRVRPNYHLTFSRSECNTTECIEALQHGINVAVVFKVKKDAPLPQKWNGYNVVDGDETDLRFLDPQGVVVGLRAKGRAKLDNTGFVILQ